MKKFLALVLIALLILGCLPAALAEENLSQVQFDPALTGDLQDALQLKTGTDLAEFRL